MSFKIRRIELHGAAVELKCLNIALIPLRLLTLRQRGFCSAPVA